MKKTEYRLDDRSKSGILSTGDKMDRKRNWFSDQSLRKLNILGMKDFMHIWINLLDNAIKFSPAKGTIAMFLKQRKDSVLFHSGR